MLSCREEIFLAGFQLMIFVLKTYPEAFLNPLQDCG